MVLQCNLLQMLQISATDRVVEYGSLMAWQERLRHWFFQTLIVVHSFNTFSTNCNDHSRIWRIKSIHGISIFTNSALTTAVLRQFFNYNGFKQIVPSRYHWSCGLVHTWLFIISWVFSVYSVSWIFDCSKTWFTFRGEHLSRATLTEIKKKRVGS